MTGGNSPIFLAYYEINGVYALEEIPFDLIQSDARLAYVFPFGGLQIKNIFRIRQLFLQNDKLLVRRQDDKLFLAAFAYEFRM